MKTILLLLKTALIGMLTIQGLTAVSAENNKNEAARVQVTATAQPINIITSTAEVLTELPEVGPVILAQVP